MKFTLSWLREHLDTEASLDLIAETLTRVGLEVEGVHNPGAALAPFTVARVLTAERHPQADKLQVLSVDAGTGPLQVVCGAPNARAGLIGVFGAPGTHVPGPDITLKVASIRGVESNGMMCSARELGLGEEHDGILELPADAPVGQSYADYAGLTDPVIEVAVTPNRPDCMGVRGIARDLAAAGLGTLKPLADVYRMATLDPVPGEGPGPEVRTDDVEGCPAFYAQGVAGVRNGQAPAWMRRRLLAIGQKPISALVDITNFMMIDLGRPLHVYDRAKLTGELVARRARPGESVTALNGRSYALDEGMTVIADAVAVHDIGGIMGGEHSGVGADTTDVLIECAYFDPDAIARTGQKLQLTSDARQRFERGVDPAFLDEGLAIATRLVLDHCGGTASAVTRSGRPPLLGRKVIYDPHLARDLGGLAVPPERQARILLSLGFSMGAIDHPDAYSDALFATIERPWPVTVPTWRRDVDGPADLVEEVIRIEGIDRVPSVPLDRPPGIARPTATPAQKLERRVRRAAAARGLDEAVTWSFVSQVDADALGGGVWAVANPISEELKVMRPSLLPGLLAAAARNTRRGVGSTRLFEIGRRYLADAEPLTLGLVLAGDKRPRGWRPAEAGGGKAAPFDAFDAKAEALALLAAAGAPVDNLQVMGEAGDAWHPGQSATLRLGPKTVLARFGMLHPATLKAFDLDGAVAAAELHLHAIPARRATGFARPPFAPPALQPVRRDFAFVIPQELAADALVRAIRGADKTAIVGARVFDLFARDGERSMAVEVTLQPLGDKAFVDAELKAIADKVVAARPRSSGEGDWVTVTSGQLTAAINPLGAELSSLTDAAGRELMTDADPAFWTGRAPLLVPVVGKPAGEVIRVDGHSYPMKQHGFARRMPFALVAAEPARAVFALTDSDETRRHYPFAFRLEVAFSLADATLAVDVRIANPGDGPMPASFGFHPAFAWPLPYGRPREGHQVVFNADEPDPLRRIATDGTIAAATRPSPLDGRTLPLADALFTQDALVWQQVRSDAVTYGAADGPRLRIAFPDTPSLGIWTKPGARFVCIEPWHGIADPQGYTGEFRDKPGVFVVPPGGERRIGMSVTLVG